MTDNQHRFPQLPDQALTLLTTAGAHQRLAYQAGHPLVA